MAHPRVAARDPVGQERAHVGPAQPCSVADRIVDLRDGGNVVVDQPERLAPERLEEPVGHEPVDLRPDVQWMHADRPVDGCGALERRRVGLPAAADLDQREQVDRVERVPDDKPLRPGQPGLQVGRPEPGRRRADDRRRPGPRGRRPRAAPASARAARARTPARSRLRRPPLRQSRRRRASPPAGAAPASAGCRRGGRSRAPGRRSCSAPGAGSWSRTSTPFSRKRAAQPPPITPPPSRPTAAGTISHAARARASPAPPPARARSRSSPPGSRRRGRRARRSSPAGRARDRGCPRGRP